ncbi:MAG: hypothetical protein HXY35_03395 [Chloroflexi bacterium]|nr:hypothetical protein [Chloroflexota bacterium]
MESQPLPALRPLRLGELLDQAIRMYRRNFVTFIGIIAVVYVPLMVLQTASTTVMTSAMSSAALSSTLDELFANYAYWGGMLSTLIIAFLQFIFVQGIATGALTRAVADNYLGKPTSILDAYRGIGKSWLTLVGALLLVGILVIVISLWWIVPCVGWFTGLGMLAYLGMAVSPMVAPVVVLEGQGMINSVQRAWFLVRRRFWPVLGTIFVLYLFNLLIVNGPLAIVNAILGAVAPSFGDPAAQLVVTAIIQAVVSIVFILIYYPLQMTAFTLIYFDLRVRTEGFDLALLMTGDASQALAAPIPQSKETLITGADLGNFAILTLAAFGLYIFLFSFIFGGIFFLGTLFN